MHNSDRIPASPPCALTIAGSDSCGGAGIQADLKAFSAFAVEGSSVLTAITAQNTVGVAEVEVMQPAMVSAQLDAVLGDLPISAAKTGMLANAGIIGVVAERFSRPGTPPLVVDPVMVATSGARLLDRDAEQRLTEELLPLATLVTPNLPEACALTDQPGDSRPESLAERMLASGCRAVLVKGGHGKGETVEDLLMTDQGRQFHYRHQRVDRRIHGTGCALSAAITAGLARGQDLQAAVEQAIEWLQELIRGTWQPLKGELGMLPFSRGEGKMQEERGR